MDLENVDEVLDFTTSRKNQSSDNLMSVIGLLDTANSRQSIETQDCSPGLPTIRNPIKKAKKQLFKSKRIKKHSKGKTLVLTKNCRPYKGITVE